VRQSVAQRVSLPAGSDEGYSPSTSAAFLKNCCTKKLLYCSAALRLQKLISVNKNRKEKKNATDIFT
jgi:hypothetical protein